MRWTRTLALSVVIGVAICIIGIYLVSVLIRDRPAFILWIKGLISGYGLMGVFVATIIAGTVVPLGSPAIIAFAAGFGMPLVPLIMVASVGYTIGIAVNYSLARIVGIKYVERKVSREQLEGMMQRWNKWGMPILIVFGLVPGFPIDLLALACGLLKTKIVYFLLISLSTKVVQFGAFALLGVTVSGWIGS